MGHLLKSDGIFESFPYIYFSAFVWTPLFSLLSPRLLWFFLFLVETVVQPLYAFHCQERKEKRSCTWISVGKKGVLHMDFCSTHYLQSEIDFQKDKVTIE